jgi:hypothetical protein
MPLRRTPIALWISIFAAAIVLSGYAFLRADARPLGNAAQNIEADCGVVSCTTYLPIVLRNYPAPWPIEVTQGVQQPDNSVMLIQDRPTFARLTITSTVAVNNVSAYLHGSRDGVPLPGSPLAALNNPRTLKATASRSALNDTFNFQLPTAWLNGTIVLNGSATNGASFAATGGSSSFTFTYGQPMQVTIVPIAYTCTSGGSGTTTPAGPYDYTTNFAYRTYPVPSIGMTTHAAVSYSGPCITTGTPPTSVPNPTGDDWEAMLDVVSNVWWNEGNFDRYYYGLVKVYCGGGCIAGIGWIGWTRAAVGFDGTNASHNGAGEVLAHEIGHNHGRRHAPGCGATGVDASFPYVSGGKGYIGSDPQPNYGFNILSQAIYVYNTYIDFMSYCGPEWVSDYTYEALHDFDNDVAAASPTVISSDRAIVVSGSIDESGDRATLRPAYALDAPAYQPEPGDYTLDLLDVRGRLLAAYAFTPGEFIVDEYRSGTAFERLGFHLNLPYLDGIAGIRVRRGNTILGTLRATAHRPALAAGVTTLGADRQSTRVRWSASDGDGEALTYFVRASTDGGATWQVIGVGVSSPYLDLNAAEFGGQSVLLEVIASDGLNSTTLQLGPFAVPAPAINP